MIFAFLSSLSGCRLFGNLGHSDNNHKYKTKIRNFNFIQPLSHSCWLEQSQGLYEGRLVASIDPKAELSEGRWLCLEFFRSKSRLMCSWKNTNRLDLGDKKKVVGKLEVYISLINKRMPLHKEIWSIWHHSEPSETPIHISIKVVEHFFVSITLFRTSSNVLKNDLT